MFSLGHVRLPWHPCKHVFAAPGDHVLHADLQHDRSWPSAPRPPSLLHVIFVQFHLTWEVCVQFLKAVQGFKTVLKYSNYLWRKCEASFPLQHGAPGATRTDWTETVPWPPSPDDLLQGFWAKRQKALKHTSAESPGDAGGPTGSFQLPPEVLC